MPRELQYKPTFVARPHTHSNPIQSLQALKYFGEAAQRIARDGIEVDKFVDFDSAMLGWHKYRDATVAK